MKITNKLQKAFDILCQDSRYNIEVISTWFGKIYIVSRWTLLIIFSIGILSSCKKCYTCKITAVAHVKIINTYTGGIITQYDNPPVTATTEMCDATKKDIRQMEATKTTVTTEIVNSHQKNEITVTETCQCTPMQ
jgi:hypothetical protein